MYVLVTSVITDKNVVQQRLVSFTRREYQLIKILLDILRHTFLNVRTRYLLANISKFHVKQKHRIPSPPLSYSLSLWDRNYTELFPAYVKRNPLRHDRTQSANNLRSKSESYSKSWKKPGLSSIISRPSQRIGTIRMEAQHICDAITDLHNPLHKRTCTARGKPRVHFSQDHATRVHPAPRIGIGSVQPRL